MATLLHQLLAFEREIRKRTQRELTELHRDVATEALVSGVTKTYKPLAEDGVVFPAENKPVNLRYEDAIQRFRVAWIEECEVVDRKEEANTRARADVLVDDIVIARGVPVGYLLFVEKQLEHVRTFLSKMVELPIGETWAWDDGQGLHVSEESVTQRVEKVPDVLKLTEATEKHPPTAQVIARDKPVGLWRTRKLSGAIPAARKRELLAQVAKLSKAVKEAREKANTVECQSASSFAEEIMGYVFDAA